MKHRILVPFLCFRSLNTPAIKAIFGDMPESLTSESPFHKGAIFTVKIIYI